MVAGTLEEILDVNATAVLEEDWRSRRVTPVPLAKSIQFVA